MTIKQFNDLVKGKDFDLYKNKGQVGVANKFNKGVRTITICAGRGWGKSILCGFLVAFTFINLFEQYRKGTKDSVKIWIVAPTYALAEKVFTYAIQFMRKVDPRIMSSGYLKGRPQMQLEANKFCWIKTRSADSPEGLTGERLDLLIVDEAADISKSVYFDRMLPSMSSKSRRGQTILIGTPRGQNQFYNFYIESKEEDAAFHFTSLEGVEVDQKEWDLAKKRYPKDLFQQNYEATFLEEASKVFRGFKNCVLPVIAEGEPPYAFEESKPGRRYVMGIDMAMRKDFSVITIFDEITHNQVYYDRFQNILYPLQVERFSNAAIKYNRASIITELVGMELPLADDLEKLGYRVRKLKMQGTISKDLAKMGTKQKAIEKLMTDIENGNIHFADIEIQTTEFDRFACRMTPAGNITYSAPEGYHDDVVMATAKANWFLRSKAREQAYRAKRSIPHIRKTFQYF